MLSSFDESNSTCPQPASRVVSYAAQRSLLTADGRTGVVMVYPHPVHGADAYANALPALRQPV